MRKSLALIIDKDDKVREVLKEALLPSGWQFSCIDSHKEAVFWVERLTPEIVFIDIDSIEKLDKDFFSNIKQVCPKAFLVLLGSSPTVQKASEGLFYSVDDFLLKPLETKLVISLLRQLSQKNRFEKKDEFPSALGFTELTGNSSCMQALRRQIKAVAPRNSWVLLTGENGTGKEVVASNLHLSSNRANRPFVVVNCAALPETLIESILFGYREGAFANAYCSKLGKFELAHRGTLFLDEIGDMSLRTQSKILRILQEQSFERLGDHRPISVDVRVIAATNKNLNEEIKKGNFRKDLFYRLNVVPIFVPPLRDRGEDVLLLAEYYLDKVALDHNCRRKKLTPSAKKLLVDYPWPGNVREVKNLMERLSVMVSENIIEAYHLLEFSSFDHHTGKESPIDIGASFNLSLKDARLQFEKEFILKRLTGLGGNVSKTADAIGVERSHLYRKLRLYGIDVKR